MAAAVVSAVRAAAAMVPAAMLAVASWFISRTIRSCSARSCARESRRHQLERERRGCNGGAGALADGCGGGTAAVRQPAVPPLLSRVLSTTLSMSLRWASSVCKSARRYAATIFINKGFDLD